MGHAFSSCSNSSLRMVQKRLIVVYLLRAGASITFVTKVILIIDHVNNFFITDFGVVPLVPI